MKKFYTKKPVKVAAIQFTGFNPDEIKEFVGDNCDIEYTGEEAWKLGKAPMTANIIIHTLEGDMKVSKGDYIIQGVKGEFYPCREDIFNETYQEIL